MRHDLCATTDCLKSPALVLALFPVQACRVLAHDQVEVARASKEWFFDDGSDDIRAIECYPNLPSRGNIFYCSYYFALNSKLRVELKFIDFRLNGGREFARERVRAFKKAMCPVFHCDEEALRAATIKG